MMERALEIFARGFASAIENFPGAVSLPSFTGASAAFAALSLARRPPPGGEALVLAVAPGLPEADALASDLRILDARGDAWIIEFPPVLEGDAASAGLRMRAVSSVAACRSGGHPAIVVATPQALLAPVPAAAAVEAATVRVGGPFGSGGGFSALVSALAAAGYERVAEVSEPGAFAVRGCVIDAWAPGEENPVRAEFFGDSLESLRSFDAALQRSTGAVESAAFPPIRDSANGDERIMFASALGGGASALFLEHAAYGSMLGSQLDGERFARAVYSGDPAPRGVPSADFATSPLPGFAETGAELARDPSLVDAVRGHLAAHLDAVAGRGGAVVEIPELSLGFECPGLAVATAADREFSHRRTRRRAAAPAGPRFASAPELESGELVVHVDHGIGRFLGTTEIETGGRRMEVISVEYADGAVLQVPVSQAHLLSRYVGVKGKEAKLHRLDGKRWFSDKVAAQRAVRDLAASLLEMQARREVTPGFACDVECDSLAAFEAAFPHEETDDQLKAIAEVKRDLASKRPMDRLLCGDAGYGKTEVAMRAAYIVAMNGRQTALLAPTTVLAEQHFETFSRRFADTPVRVEALSRLQTPQARRGALARIASGAADIVIGTHALLAKTVKFRNLGLIVIDEEQRFGVRHKEHLKRLRATADVLAMSATPIPRSLYMAITGARDLSVLRTPPRERVAVETKVMRASDEAVAAAIRRELARGGQVYFLHNRVLTLGIVHKRLRTLVPEARIEVAHGQLPSGELAARMQRFQSGKADILLCTSIVESGLDIPRANTIVIDRADCFGMADLYQLRGRVGRASVQGHAIFLLPGTGSIDSDARERLGALRKHAGLGAGFDLAMRDLELRGAGNLLGAEQSGHIAAVGFGLYCQLLRRTVAALEGKKLPMLVDVALDLDFVETSPGRNNGECGACLPYDYVEEEPQRMEFHRRLAEAASAGAVRDLRRELEDRYGRMPKTARRLARLAELRVRCAGKGIVRLDVHGTRAALYTDHSRIPSAVARIDDVSADRKIARLFRIVEEFKA